MWNVKERRGRALIWMSACHAFSDRAATIVWLFYSLFSSNMIPKVKVGVLTLLEPYFNFYIKFCEQNHIEFQRDLRNLKILTGNIELAHSSQENVS